MKQSAAEQRKAADFIQTTLEKKTAKQRMPAPESFEKEAEKIPVSGGTKDFKEVDKALADLMRPAKRRA
jgi:hypothetical protein